MSKKNPRGVPLLLTLLAVFLLSGCGSTITHTMPMDSLDDRFNEDLGETSLVYSGLCLNIKMIEKNNNFDTREEIIAIVSFFDIPLSLAADTVLLPFDLSFDAYYRWFEGTKLTSLCSRK